VGDEIPPLEDRLGEKVERRRSPLTVTIDPIQGGFVLPHLLSCGEYAGLLKALRHGAIRYQGDAVAWARLQRPTDLAIYDHELDMLEATLEGDQRVAYLDRVTRKLLIGRRDELRRNPPP
jgi:hypothetical protein